MHVNKDLKMTTALIIFVRNPILGKVKSRLAKSIGEKDALEVYKRLLERTKEAAEYVKVECQVYYSEKIEDNDIWNSEKFQKFVQKGENLGEKMENAMNHAFSMGYEKVVLIGSDLYHMKARILRNAFIALETEDFVIGPAEDGGFYLIGGKTIPPPIFKNKNWGTSEVLEKTLKDLQNTNYATLETLNDIDYLEDLEGIEEFKKYTINV